MSDYIVHVTYRAKYIKQAIHEFSVEEKEHIKRVVQKSPGHFVVTTEKGVEHLFMSVYEFEQWREGRTYHFSDGTMWHGDQQIK